MNTRTTHRQVIVYDLLDPTGEAISSTYKGLALCAAAQIQGSYSKNIVDHLLNSTKEAISLEDTKKALHLALQNNCDNIVDMLIS